MTKPCTTSGVLLAAANLIARTGWTQGPYAKDANGVPIDPTRAETTCFCVSGALIHVCHGLGSLLYRESRAQLQKSLGFPYCSLWNEAHGRTKEEVIEALRKAAKLRRLYNDPEVRAHIGW